MRDIAPGADSAEIISFAEARAKLTAAAQADDRAVTTDFDAFLAAQGHDRAWLETAYATIVTNEDMQAPDVASCRADIATMRDLRAMKQDMLNSLQADVDRYLKIERRLEEQMSIAKYNAMLDLVDSGAIQDDADGEAGAGSQPKGRRKRKWEARR